MLMRIEIYKLYSNKYWYTQIHISNSSVMRILGPKHTLSTVTWSMTYPSDDLANHAVPVATGVH